MRRAGNRQWMLKPQDLAVALKLSVAGGQRLPYAVLGEVMYLSRFEAHAAVQRLSAAGLVAEVDGAPKPVRQALRAFVLYGARYAYPPVRGGATVGVPTAHGAAPLKELMAISSESIPVWPRPEGVVRGQSLLPLYGKLPLAALGDAGLYELLALFDALRAGQARERKLASELLEERLQ